MHTQIHSSREGTLATRTISLSFHTGAPNALHLTQDSGSETPFCIFYRNISESLSWPIRNSVHSHSGTYSCF